MYGLDILFNLNRAIYDQGMIQMNRSALLKHYLKDEFLLDFVVFVATILWSGNENLKILALLVLCKIVRIQSTIDNFTEMMNLTQNQQAYVDLARLGGMIIYIAHVIGCLFYFLTIIESKLDIYKLSLGDTTKLILHSLKSGKINISLLRIAQIKGYSIR